MKYEDIICYISVTTSAPTPSTRWQKTIWVCLTGWVVVIIFSGNVLSESIGVVLFLSSWVGLPIAIFKDAREVGEFTDWPLYTWAYLIGSFIWFISILAGGIYLFQRYRKVSQSTAKDTSQSGSRKSDHNNTVNNTQSKADNQRGDPDVEQGKSDHSIGDMRKKAENKVVDSINAKKSGDIESAIELLNDSVDQYETLKQKAGSNAETRLLEEIEETVQLVKDKRDKFERSIEGQSELVDDLERAERYLQTAFVAHLEGEDTLANLRYRQARERYKASLQRFEDGLQWSNNPVEVRINSEKEIDTDDISEFFEDSSQLQQFTDQVEEIEQISDLVQLDYRTNVSENILTSLEDIKESKNQYESFIEKSKLLLYYSNYNRIEFKNKDEIKYRCDQADNGYKITNTDV